MEPTLQRVTIGDLTLQPYFYEESSEDGAVLVRMKAAITADEQDRLFAMRKPKPGQFLDVVGPDGVTKSLRLGRLLWSRDGEQLRQEINLVDKAWDAGTEEHSSWMLDVMEPFRTRAEEQLALQVARLARLVDALVDAGALTAEQATAARDVGKTWKVSPGVYDVTVQDNVGIGIPVATIQGVTVEAGKTIEKTADFAEGTLKISAVQKGKPFSASLLIEETGNAADKKRERLVNDYTGAEGKIFNLRPGIYEITVTNQTDPKKPVVKFSGISVEAGKAVEKTAEF